MLIIRDGVKHRGRRLNSGTYLFRTRPASAHPHVSEMENDTETRRRPAGIGKEKKKKKQLMFGSLITGRQKEEVQEEITAAPTFNLPTF